MSKVTTVGIDLAKRVFALHGVDAAGRVGLRRVCRREELLVIITQLPPCLIGMEACCGAHQWAREFARFGHTVRLINGCGIGRAKRGCAPRGSMGIN